jgi:transcriptional regulator with XRE-family HTH domain
VGAAIRAAREAKGLTMSAASAYTGGRIGVSLWSIYEIGATELKLKNAVRIARALRSRWNFSSRTACARRPGREPTLRKRSPC